MIRQNTLITLQLFVIALSVNFIGIPQNLFFGYEQGRDAQAISEIYKNRDAKLIGPKTDIEGLFIPPWYYYIMTLPYGFANGNPIAGSVFLIILASTTAPIIYLLAREMLKSTSLSTLSGLIAAFSWEIISYSRWLSNTTLAFPAIAIAYYSLYKYIDTKSTKFFLIFSFFASVATGFQASLAPQFVFVIIALIVFKVLKLPSLKIILISLMLYVLIYSPLIIFDFKNQHLITKSLYNFLTGTADFNWNLNPIGSLNVYVEELITVINRSLFNIRSSGYTILFILLGILGLILLRKNRVLFFVVIISFMSLGILIFNVRLSHIFQGTVIGWILLTTIAVGSLYQRKFSRPLAFLLVALLIFGWFKNYKNLQSNEGFFFAPEQNVLKIEDQKNLIDFMHHDSEIKPYRFESFTVPYLHSEGWQYLHQYYYPRQESKHSKLVYIAIEKNIPEFWEKKWIDELGESELIFEKKFGQIRLQKRQIH